MAQKKTSWWWGLPVLVFWFLPLSYLFENGILPRIADDWAFPYYSSAHSYFDIVMYFDRQPLLFQLLGRFLTTVFGQPFVPMAAIHLLCMALMIYWIFEIVSEYAGVAAAFATTLFLALGFEFHAYAMFTRYDFLCAFFPLAFLQALRKNKFYLAAGCLFLMVHFRSLFLYYAVAYFFYVSIAAARARTWRKAAIVLAIILSPLPFCIRNYSLYDYWGFTSWTGENIQNAIFRSGALPEAHNRQFVKDHIQASDRLSDETKRLYALGLQWPTNRIAVIDILKGNAPSELTAEVQKLYPRRSIRALIYSHPEEGNGYLFGPLLNHGSLVAKDLLRGRHMKVAYRLYKNAYPLAMAQSTLWFLPGFGQELIKKGGLSKMPFPDDFKSDHAQNVGNVLWPRYLATYTSLPEQLHRFFQRALLPSVLGFAFLLLAWLGIRFVLGWRFDEFLFLTATMTCFLFLTSVFGEFSENARFNFYWKPLALLLFPVLCAKAYGLIRPRLPNPIMLRNKAT